MCCFFTGGSIRSARIRRSGAANKFGQGHRRTQNFTLEGVHWVRSLNFASWTQWEPWKQEHWERWRAKRKLVSGSKHWGGACWRWAREPGRGHPLRRGSPRYPPRENFEIVYSKSCMLVFLNNGGRRSHAFRRWNDPRLRTFSNTRIRRC